MTFEWHVKGSREAYTQNANLARHSSRRNGESMTPKSW
jgi:hypothetical protein